MTDESHHLAKGSAARLLSDWRAAERDAIAAHESAEVATLASAAAEKAARAAQETADSAKLALEAATRAEHAARETAEAASILASGSARAKTLADAEVERADAAEGAARDAFHAAQDSGFPAGDPKVPPPGS